MLNNDGGNTPTISLKGIILIIKKIVKKYHLATYLNRRSRMGYNTAKEKWKNK